MSRRRRPHWWEAVVAQTLLLGRSRRPWLLLAFIAALWGLFWVQALGRGSWSAAQLISPGWVGLAFFIGGIWGTQLWNGEPPGDRWDHWGLPLDTTANDLARLAGGAVWMILGISFLVALNASVLAGSTELSVLSVPPLVWLSFLTGGLIAYVLGGALASVTGSPLEVGLVASVATLVAVFELVMEGRAKGVLAPVGAVLEAAFTGTAGLLTAVAGPALGARIRLLGEGSGSPWVSLGFGPWLLATAIWLTSAVAVYVLASVWFRRR